jgi:hypothetical protein
VSESKLLHKKDLAQAIVIMGIVALLLSACGSAPEQTPTATNTFVPTSVPNSPPHTPTTILHPTLPPSYTPTFTLTPYPTRTATYTPTITPTRTTDELCEGFSGSFMALEEIYTEVDEITLFAQADTPEVAIVFTLTNLDNDEARTVVLLGGQTYFSPFPLSLAAGPGSYEWSLGISISEDGIMCERAGTFTLISTPEEATAEVAAEVATQTPHIIIVTATPGTVSPVPTQTPYFIVVTVTQESTAEATAISAP